MRLLAKPQTTFAQIFIYIFAKQKKLQQKATERGRKVSLRLFYLILLIIKLLCTFLPFGALKLELLFIFEFK